MRIRVLLAVCTAAALLIPGVALAAPGGTAPTKVAVQHSCAQPTQPGYAACQALRRTDVASRKGIQPAASTPAGYAPADLTAAYHLPAASTTSTVAIVDAYDDPTVEADQATYRAQYALPACTSATGCFTKVDQRGGTSYPAPDSGWATEMALDVDMVSAICPSCHILLVEADDNSSDNLGAAVDEAVTLGAKYVSNSWAGPEDSTEPSYDGYFNHPGVVITASTADAGYGVYYPAASPYVTAVGGTSLNRDTTTTRGWRESAWSGAGSGCSQYEPKPVWQTGSGCARRTVADVSAIGDPGTGVAVYTATGWQVYGGTSVATPIIASVYALAGTPQAGSNPAEYPYDAALADPTAISDATGGSNGTCTPAYLCNGVTGYDGPTGLGTPNGVAAFGYRQHGTVAGTVTSAGAAVPDATVTVAGRQVATDAGGKYALDLPAGSYQGTVDKYGYLPQTVALTVTGGATVTNDVILTVHATATIAGTVTDGSGHGGPLAAKVTADDGAGHLVAANTDATGHYSVAVLTGASYTLRVEATVPGYLAATKTVAVDTSDVTADAALLVDQLACTASGYHPVERGSTEPFSGTSVPSGWRVVNTDPHYPGYAAQPGWEFTNPGNRANTTGGGGNFAIVDSDHSGAMHVQDTALVGATVNMSTVDNPTVRFSTDLNPAVNSTATVDVSTDGGTTWTSVWRSTGMHGQHGTAAIVVPLPTAAHQSAVALRFHFIGSWSQWWELDDVFVGDRSCEAV
ncbi:MAG TPA: carboxypeptidase regulatory-like domain-containing protein [Rugosimonospora sp.]|jgi:hypothetical protein